MTVSGTNEKDERIDAFNNMPPGDKYYLLFDGAYHSSYNDYRPSGRRGLRQDRQTIDNIHTYLESTSLAFWDAYLKQDNAAKQYLQSDVLSTAGRDAFPSSSRDAFPSSSRGAFPSSSSGQASLFKK
jgi:predicted dienelactone hydrolase